MKLEKLLQKIDNKVPILIKFDYPIYIGKRCYRKDEIYYSGRLENMPYSSIRLIQKFKVRKILFEEYEHDLKISIII